MANRMFSDEGAAPFQLEIGLNPKERLLQLTLELADQMGLLDDDLPADFVGEAFIEEGIVIREREFDTFVKVLHYNNIRYRVQTLK